MFELDETSHLLKVDTDLTMAEIERRLNPLGFTLGYFFPPKNHILLEEALSQSLPNAYGLLYGSLDELCVALQWEAKAEEVFCTKVAPRKATGPNWKNMMLGSGRKLGLIYQAVLKIFPSPPAVATTLVSLSAPEESFSLEREMIRRELVPRAFARFSKAEGGRGLPLSPGDFFLLLEWAGSSETVQALRHEAENLLRRGKAPFHTLQNHSQRAALKILRQGLPSIPWGGEILQKEDPQERDLEKQIFEVLR